MPDQPVVDTHVLLADPGRFEMATVATGYWDDKAQSLDRPFGLDDYAADAQGIAVEAVIALQAGVAPAYGLLEAAWARDIALRNPRLGAFIAWAPLEYGERAETYLEALAALGPRVVGVRRGLELEPAGFGRTPRFVRGVQGLARHGLSFELGVKQHQFADALALVEACPDVAIMLDHIGKPALARGDWRDWSHDVARLARCPNLWCKVSGVVTEADHERWTVESIRAPIERVLEVFGEDRVVFGSDWPVVRLAGSLRRWVEALDTILAPLAAPARRKIWSENAKRFYRLPGGRR